MDLRAGPTIWESHLNSIIYKIIFCVFVVIGSVLPLTSVFYFSDAMIFAMAFPNVSGIVHSGT